MKFTSLEWEILAAGTEDAYGLFELMSIARGIYPNLDDTELRRLAIATVKGLIQRGLLHLMWFWHHGSREQAVPSEAVATLLDDADMWRAPDRDEDPYLAIGSTEAGASLWEESPRPSKANGTQA